MSRTTSGVLGAVAIMLVDLAAAQAEPAAQVSANVAPARASAWPSL